MTQEEKAKAYDEAIEKFKEHFTPTSDGIIADGISRELIEDLFPKLKESEDEKIKKAIHIYLDWLDGRKDNAPKGEYSIKDMIAWLEKQNKQKNSYKITFEDVLVLECAMKTVKRTEGGNELYEKLVLLYNKIHNAYLVEKQGELKQVSDFKADDWYVSKVDHKIHNIYQQGKTALEAINEEKVDNANKVEQKFHEGDWIVNNNSGDVFQVTEIEDDMYCLCPLDGEIMGHLRIIDVDNEYHLWTIKDAKDGDVLYSKEHNLLWLYKDLEQYHSCINLNCSNNISISYDIVIPKDVCPATKEQCNHLFEKMRDVGYEWDKTKKELIQIEKQGGQKPTIRERYENIGKSEWFKRTHEGMSVSVEDDKELKWTKEDEKIYQSIIDDTIQEFQLSAKQIEWLKALKRRMKEQ